VSLFDEPGFPPAAVRPDPPTRRVRLQVAYDGRAFHGFAAQAVGVRTVAGVLAGALARVLNLPAGPALVCAGRTDAGVHAWDQWVHADLPAPDDSPFDPTALQRRLVSLLAPEVVVRRVEPAPPGWDARHSARSRTYRYSVLVSPVPDPFRAGFVWWHPRPLDVRAMQLAADAVIGEHDFATFCRRPTGPDGAPVSLVRRVTAAAWSTPEPELVRFEITANAFCQQMVRALVGTLVEVGTGRRRAGDMLATLHAADRAAAAPVAPPDGLVLWEVRYPPEG